MAVVLAKGQLSYLILSCLSEKDMYGLELIDEIKKRSGFEIKMPSLYSNLNRMKELKYISTYLKESTKGPKCAYSSITEQGRMQLKSLQEVFETQNSVQTEEEVDKPVEEVDKPVENEVKENVEESKIKDSYEDYDDFFAEIPEGKNEESPALVENVEIESDSETEEDVGSKEEEVQGENAEIMDEVQEEIEPEISKAEEVSEHKDDAVFLKNDVQDESVKEHNQKLFDVSRDYYKYRNKKSFSENQIEMVVNSALPIEEQQEKTAMNVNSLKEALLQSKQGNYDAVVLPNSISENKKDDVVEEQQVDEVVNAKDEIKDDGVFITDRVDYIPKTKRFEPPRLTSLLSNVESTPLPAPKRNVNLDPNCSDVKAKIEDLYAKTNNNALPKQEEKTKIDVEFDNYEDLKDYYETQNISFRVYKRPEKRMLHNTNKITFYIELIMFGILSLGSGALFLILNSFGLTNPNTNFLYYLFPIIYFIYLAYKFYCFKKVQRKVPRPLLNVIAIWSGLGVSLALIFCLNLVCGMSVANILACSTTLFLPAFVVILMFVIRHYTMLYALKKYWK